MEMSKEKVFVSAVIYLHNNGNALEPFIERVNKILNENFETYEIICVDDASTDGSAEHIKLAAEKINGGVVNLITMSYYQGLECAMIAGVDLSIGDFVFEFDTVLSDFQSDLIMQVYRRALEGYDIVSASPRHISKMTSKLFYLVFNKYSGNVYKLSTETFRVLSRRAINRVEIMSKTIPYRKAIYVSSGLKVDSIMYDNTQEPPISAPEMRINRKETAIDTLMLFTDVAYRVSLFLSGLMLLFTLSTALYAIIAYLGKNRPVAGWTPLMGLISIGFFGVFVILTIIIKHLNLILKLIFRNQKYLISSIDKLK